MPRNNTMKSIVFLAGATLVGSSFWVQGGVKSADLDRSVQAMQAAQSLTVVFDVTRLPAAPEKYTLTYSKPNLFRVDSPGSLVVSDGKTLTTLDKASNTFTQEAVTTAGATGEAVAAWRAFFDAKAFSGAKTAALGAKRRLRGVPTTELTLDMPEGALTLYLDDATGVPRGASLTRQEADKAVSTLAVASELTVGREPLGAETFVFTPPAGATKAEAPVVAAVPYAEVQAIFTRSCAACHGSSGGLNLGSHASVMAGAAGRAVVVPGNPEGSRLVQVISGTRPRMPVGGPPLPASDVKKISDWIKGGAKPE